ncbi:MAG TPA: hypothetical protein PKY10_13470, partial [Lentisphaeria bacterium]|nr:hypothetical protein [Lentisphaeria bacterium]
MAFIIKQKRRDGKISVHLTESEHRPGRTPRHHRQHLGVLDTEADELILAKGQPEPSGELLELLRKKGIVYRGRRSPSRSQPKAAALPSWGAADVRVEEIGRVGLLGCLARSSGLADCLWKCLGVEDGSRILRLAMHQVCDEGAVYLALDWWDDIGGVDTSGLSSSAAGGLLADIGRSSAVRRAFFVEWLRACGMPKALIHDTTSISSYSSELELAECGYNRDGDNLPQVNFAVATAKVIRGPLWYRLLPGSIPDVASLQCTSAMLIDLGLEGFSFSLDRGYYSRDNLVAMLDAGIRFLIGVPLHLKQAKELAARHLGALTRFKHRFLANGTPIGHVACQYQVERRNGTTVELPAHLYFSEERRHQASQRLEKTVLELAAKAEKLSFESPRQARQWLEENARSFAKFFGVASHDGHSVLAVKPNRVANALKSLGLTLIVTSPLADESEAPSREEVLEDY